MTLNVGVLALQGAVREHIYMIKCCDANGIAIKRPEELSAIDALIIPGGESTTIGKLLVKYNFIEPIKQLFARGIPIYGTCAGLILLASRIAGQSGDNASNKNVTKLVEPPLLGLMDIEVRRNAFGRQCESYEADLNISGMDEDPFRAVFIRAPWIESVGPKVEVMAEFDGKIVMAREEKLLVTAFHPELTADHRIHAYFISMINQKEANRNIV